MATYIHWQDFYETEFMFSYNNFFSSKNKKRTIEYYNNFYKLFKKSCTLLQYYLNNNGLYQFSDLDVIREAFYIELIHDGDDWIDALNTAEFIEKNVDFANNIDFINTVTEKKLHIFKKLKKTAEGLL